MRLDSIYSVPELTSGSKDDLLYNKGFTVVFVLPKDTVFASRFNPSLDAIVEKYKNDPLTFSWVNAKNVVNKIYA